MRPIRRGEVWQAYAPCVLLTEEDTLAVVHALMKRPTKRMRKMAFAIREALSHARFTPPERDCKMAAANDDTAREE